MYQLMQLVHGLAGLMNTAHPLSMPVPASAPDYINTPGEFRSPSSALVTAPTHHWIHPTDPSGLRNGPESHGKASVLAYTCENADTP